MSDPLTQAQAAYDTFLEGFRSVVLATVDADGVPTASYAPCAVDERRDVFVFVSGLSEHTANLESNGRASALFVEDEASAGQIFARRRLTFSCEARVLERGTAEHAEAARRFVERFGKMGEFVSSMSDFRAVRLHPRSGRFVIGFGAAFDVVGDDLSRLVHVKGEGQGHGSAHGGGHGHGGGRAHGGPVRAGPTGFPPEVVRRVVEHMNDDHADALLLMARVQGATPAAQAARLAAVDETGLDLSVTVEGTARPLRLPFPAPLSSADELRPVLIRMTQEARAAGTPGQGG